MTHLFDNTVDVLELFGFFSRRQYIIMIISKGIDDFLSCFFLDILDNRGKSYLCP